MLGMACAAVRALGESCFGNKALGDILFLFGMRINRHRLSFMLCVIAFYWFSLQKIVKKADHSSHHKDRKDHDLLKAIALSLS